MLRARTVLLILLQLRIALIIEGVSSLDIRFYNLTVEGSSPKLSSCHGEVITVDDHQVINAHVEFSKALRNVNVNGTLDVLRGGKKYRVYDNSLDFCKALRGRRVMSMILIVYNQFLAFGKVPHSCPLPAHVNYTITNYRVNTEQLPIYTPHMNFSFEVKISDGQDLVFTIKAFGFLESKNTENVENKN